MDVQSKLMNGPELTLKALTYYNQIIITNREPSK